MLDLEKFKRVEILQSSKLMNYLSQLKKSYMEQKVLKIYFYKQEDSIILEQVVVAQMIQLPHFSLNLPTEKRERMEEL